MLQQIEACPKCFKYWREFGADGVEYRYWIVMGRDKRARLIYEHLQFGK
ncbi:MAG: hypothetical protein ACYCQJ_01425 [Nitrososphaerales archaeon]